MPDFRQRSYEPEMIDFSVPEKLLHKNLRELEFLNRYFGGHAVSVKGLKKLMLDPEKTYHIVDLGCGGGDTLKHIALWARKHSYRFRLTGIDLSREAIRYLKASCTDYPEISALQADYRDVIREGMDADIFHCSLFCHHLTDDELKELFRYFRDHAQTGFVVNDLFRSALGYYGSRLLTIIGNGSALSKNDGPVSVLKSFRMDELKQYMNAVSIEHFQLFRVWLYRILIIGYAG